MPSNGNYSQSDLVLIEPALGWPSGYGQPRLRRNHVAITAQLRSKGFGGSVNEIYRTMATQVYYRNLYLSGQGSPAAIPGKSKHGDGWAEDWNTPMNQWNSSMQLFWLSVEGPCGYSSAQGRADNEPWHKVSVKEPNPGWEGTSTAGGGSTPITNTTTTEDEDDMKLVWDTGGTGWLVTGPTWVGLPSMQIYNLFKRVITSNQAAAQPDTFNRAEVDMMNATQVGAYQRTVGGPTAPFTLDTTKLADAVATALKTSGLNTTVDFSSKAFTDALDAGFVRSMTAYANAAGAKFDTAKLADSVAQSLQKTGIVTTVDTSAVTAAVLAAINRANAAIGKSLQQPVS